MKVLLVLAGEPPDESLLAWRAEEADFVIAVDGGMNALIHAGIQPDLLVGDFDSLNLRLQVPSLAKSFARRIRIRRI